MGLKYVKISDYFQENIEKSQFEDILGDLFSVKTKEFPYEPYPKYYESNGVIIPIVNNPRAFMIKKSSVEDANNDYHQIKNSINTPELVPYKEICYVGECDADLCNILYLSDIVDCVNVSLKGEMRELEFRGGNEYRFRKWVLNNKKASYGDTQLVNLLDEEYIQENVDSSPKSYKLMTEKISNDKLTQVTESVDFDLGDMGLGEVFISKNLFVMPSVCRIFGKSSSSPMPLLEQIENIKDKVGDIDYKISAEYE